VAHKKETSVDSGAMRRQSGGPGTITRRTEQEKFMRRKLVLTLVLAILAGEAAAQGTQAGTDSPNLTQKKVAAKKAASKKRRPRFGVVYPPGMKPYSYQQPTLEQLNAALRRWTSSELHDIYLDAGNVGNKETVSLLLERLRLDYKYMTEPPPGVMFGAECTYFHLIDALKRITKSDQGMYYSRWAAWWEKNRELSPHQWLLNGFAERGLHIAEPVDRRFGMELIQLLGNRDYFAREASQLLDSAPPEMRFEWLAQAAASDDRVLRLGAISGLGEIKTAEGEVLLRKLSKDRDREVRTGGLDAVNGRLRATLAATPGRARGLETITAGNAIGALSFAGDLLVVGYRSGKVLALDARSFRPRWAALAPMMATDFVLEAGRNVILASREGGVASLDQRGSVLWERCLVREQDDVRRLLLYGSDIMVVRYHTIELLDAKTGVTKSMISVKGSIKDADSQQNLAFFLDESGLHSLDDGRAPDSQFSDGWGLAVSRQSVCATAGPTNPYTESRVMCYSPDTLAVLWTCTVKQKDAYGHSLAPIQDGSRVFVPTPGELAAYRVDDGSLLWAAAEGLDSSGSIVATAHGLLLNNDYRLELRDSETGELRRVWPKISMSNAAVRGRFVAIAGMQDDLVIIDLSEPD
jgi:outer membrane protein assembly factor BamB